MADKVTVKFSDTNRPPAKHDLGDDDSWNIEDDCLELEVGHSKFIYPTRGIHSIEIEEIE